jgi:hypothetical protein
MIFVHNYNWFNGNPFANSYCYNKIKENIIYATSCFFGPNQNNSCVTNSALLNLAFTDISDISVSVSHYLMVTPDNYHPPLVLHFKLIFDCCCTSLNPQCNYGKGDYLLLMIPYTMLSGSLVTTACHVLRLQMEEKASRYGGSCEYIE